MSVVQMDTRTVTGAVVTQQKTNPDSLVIQATHHYSERCPRRGKPNTLVEGLSHEMPNANRQLLDVLNTHHKHYHQK